MIDTVAIVSRVVLESIENPPKVKRFKTTKNLANLKFKKVEGTYKFNGVKKLMFDVINAARKADPLWVWPEYFDYEKTYKKMQTIGDVAKVLDDGFKRFAEGQAEKAADEKQENDLREKLKNVALVDLDQLLCGKVSWEEVQKFYLDGEFHDERYSIDSIKLHLRTPKDKAIMDKLDMTISDMLCGRTDGKQSTAADKICKSWNKKLGFKCFGYE